MPHEHHELPRVLTSTHAAAIVVGIIIGSGIFLVPREMMAAVGSSSLVYAVWVAAGLLSLFGAMSYAELAAMKPRVGGEYAFLHDAYGPTTAFLYTWTWTLIAKPASIATIAAGLMRVLGTFAAFSFLTHPALGSILWSQLAAIAATWLITSLNIVSTLESANLQTLLTWLKVLIILVIAAFCFTALHHISTAGWHNFATTYAGARGGFSGFMIALVAALWAYDGWSDVSQLAGEVRNPQRSLPLALVGGVATVAALYMLTNAAIQYALPANSIANSARPAADAMRLAAGHAGAALVSIAMAISIAATFVGSSLSGARVPFAAAQDRLFPPALAAIHPRFHTPYKSLILQAVISSLLLLAVGKFQALFSLAIISEWLFYALTTASVFVFRHREPHTPRPYRVTGYPIVPALFIAAAILLIVFSFLDQPWTSAAGAAVILAGIPIHHLYQRRKTQSLIPNP
jgi:APA family basic amino acid/polyamine antiporter